MTSRKAPPGRRLCPGKHGRIATVSDVAAVPRYDRAWPPGAFAVSLAGGLGSLVGSAALVASAGSLRHAAELVGVFVVLACIEGAVYADALRPWLQGRPVPVRAWLMQVPVALLAFLGFAGGPAMGAAGLFGFLAGVSVTTASTIRYARVTRGLVYDDETRLPQERTGAASDTPDRPVRAGRVPQVGAVLRETFTEVRDRSLAWAAATVVVAVGGLAADTPNGVLPGVVLLGVATLAWVSRRLIGLWRALRDFERAVTEPRRAHVLLLRDPNPRVTRPLLGVWNEEPTHVEGRLPPAEAVYRCDARRDALLSTQGGLVVHEAWLDTGPGAHARPRWVAADAGIALPHRQATLGRRYLASIVAAERPARPRPLTMPAPHPTMEIAPGTAARAVTDATPETGRWIWLFAWRLAGLVLAAAVLTWLLA